MAETILNPVTKVTQTINDITYTAPFGIEKGEYVQIADGNNKFTLKDFYNNFKDFKTNGQFIQWHKTSGPDDTKDLNMKIWYKTDF